MPGKQESRCVADATRTAIWLCVKEFREIGERTFSHELCLDVPCHGLAVAAEDIIWSLYELYGGAQ